MDYAMVAWRMMMTITQEYPIVKFKCYLNPVHQFINDGYIIGERLYVGRTNDLCRSVSIYNYRGFKAIPIEFEKWADATQMAELLYEQYQNYFDLWYDYPQANIPLLTQYTINRGQELYATIQHFSGHVISYNEFVDVYTRLSN